MSTQYDYINQYKKYVYIVIGISLLMLMSVFLVSDVNALSLQDVIKKNDGITYNNYTTINNTYTNTTDVINGSYAYLPGRPGGQTLNGGTTSGNLALNGSMANGNVIIQPNGGKVGIGGVLLPTTSLEVYGAGTSANSGILITNSYVQGSTRQAKIKTTHSDNSEEPITLIQGQSQLSGANTLRLGGGVSTENSVTLIRFYTGVTNTTLGGIERMQISSSGNVGIGTSPQAQLHTTGTVCFANYGAGTATFDAGGNITSVSDSKYKTNIRQVKSGSALSQINKWEPVIFKYTVESGLDSNNDYFGFLADQIEKISPSAVKRKDDVIYENKLKTKGKTADEDEYETIATPLGTTTASLDDRALIATLTLALQEEDTKVESMKLEIELLNERIKKLEAART